MRLEHGVDGAVVPQLILRDRPFLGQSVYLSLHALQFVGLCLIKATLSLQLTLGLGKGVLVLATAESDELLLSFLLFSLRVVLARAPACDKAGLTVRHSTFARSTPWSDL